MIKRGDIYFIRDTRQSIGASRKQTDLRLLFQTMQITSIAAFMKLSI